MSIERKILEALARHEKACQAVECLSRGIGEALAKCSVVVRLSDYTISNAERAELFDEKTGKDKTHLWQAFQVREPSSCGWGEVPMGEDGISDALSEGSEFECEHCYQAYHLILQRKSARQELGVARRLIRHYGKKALASAGKAGEA